MVGGRRRGAAVAPAAVRERPPRPRLPRPALVAEQFADARKPYRVGTSCSEASTAVPSTASGEDNDASSICSSRPRLSSARRVVTPEPAPPDVQIGQKQAAAPSRPAAKCVARAPPSLKALAADEEALNQSLLGLDFKEMLRQFEGKPALWQGIANQPVSESDLSATQQEAKLNASLRRLENVLAGLQVKVDGRCAAATRRTREHADPARASSGPGRPASQQERGPPSRVRSASLGRRVEVAAADGDSQVPAARAARASRASSAQSSRESTDVDNLRRPRSLLSRAAISVVMAPAVGQPAATPGTSVSSVLAGASQSSKPSSVLNCAAARPHDDDSAVGKPTGPHASGSRRPSHVPSAASLSPHPLSRPPSVASCGSGRERRVVSCVHAKRAGSR